MTSEERIWIRSGVLRLEGRLRVPVGPATRGVVLCHPHPLFGGDMDNPVVLTLARRFAAEGWWTLRFNFRGTGNSEGSYDGGAGEVADVHAACGLLRDRQAHDRVTLAGYSFGAWAAARAAEGDRRLVGLALIAPPFLREELQPFPVPRGPLAAATGSCDAYCPLPTFEGWFAQVPGEKRQIVMPRVDHFFAGAEDHLAKRLVEALLTLPPGAAGSP